MTNASQSDRGAHQGLAFGGDDAFDRVVYPFHPPGHHLVRSFMKKPLDGLVASVNALSAGNYGDPAAGQDLAGETGSVAKALVVSDLRWPMPDGSRPKPFSNPMRPKTGARARKRSGPKRPACSARVVSALAGSLADLSRGPSHLPSRVNTRS